MRLRGWILFGALSAGATALGVAGITVLPEQTVERANDAMYACLERVEKGKSDDPWACKAEIERMVAFPRKLPWHRSKADPLIAETTCRASELELVLFAGTPTLMRRPQVVARREALACRGPGLLGEIFSVGAFSDVLRIGETQPGTGGIYFPQKAA